MPLVTNTLVRRSLAGATALAIEVAGHLGDGVPERGSYQRFTVRTAPAPMPA